MAAVRGLSLRSILYAITQLCNGGLISYEWCANTINHYVLNDPKAAMDTAKLTVTLGIWTIHHR
jgi:hypothetical protein